MDDFNENEHDWFFDLDESIKSVTNDQVGSPTYCNNEVEFANFSALNVPIDESIFKKKLGVEGTNQQNFISSELNDKTLTQSTVDNQNFNVEQPHSLALPYENIQSFVYTSSSNNITENNFQSVNDPVCYFNTSVTDVNCTNSNYSVLNSSALPSTLNSNYVDCKPSTSSSSLNVAPNNTQVYQKYDNDLNNCSLQSTTNNNWMPTAIQTTTTVNNLQPISQSLSNYTIQNINSDNVQSQNLVISQPLLNTGQTVSEQYYQTNSNTQIQVPTLIAFNQSIQRKSPSLEQSTYHAIQPNNTTQQISYIDAQHVPYIQKNLNTDSTSEIQVLQHPVESSITNNNNYNVIIQQPQQINQINLVSNQTLQQKTHLTASNFLSTINSQETVILPQNSQLINSASSNQQFYSNITVQSSSQVQSQDIGILNNMHVQQQTSSIQTSQTSYRTMPLTGRRTQKTINRRQSKQFGQSGLHINAGGSSSSDGPVNTLGAVMQKIYATTGDMNAAVRFTPEMAVEFSQIASQLNELKEQQERTGINLSDQIKACEERIVKFLSVAEPTTQTTPTNSTQKKQNSQSNLTTSTTSTTLLKPTSRGKTQRRTNTLYSCQPTTTNNNATNNFQLQNNNSFYQNVSISQTSTEQTSNFLQQNQILGNNIDTPVIINNVQLDQQNSTRLNQTINAQSITSQQNVQYTTIHEIPQQSVVIPNSQTIEPSASINFGSTKRARGWAAKYQEIQVQKSQQQNAQPVTMVEMHPMLAGHITSQHLSQIISAAGINNTGSTTILVEFNGQQLPIVVSTTLSTNASIPIKPEFYNKDVTQKEISTLSNINMNSVQNDMYLQSTTVNQVLDGNVGQIGLKSSFKNFKPKKGGRRSSLAICDSNLILSSTSNVTPTTQSTSFDLDDTIEKVASSAKTFTKRSTANSFSYSNAQSCTVAAALEAQYLKSSVKRKPRIKNTYDSKEKKSVLSPPVELISSAELGKNIFDKKNERKSKLENYFEKLRTSLNTIDLSSTFKNKSDCFDRLLPFAFFGEPSLTNDFFEQFDYGYLKHSINIHERIKKLKSKFQDILFRESMVENTFKTEQNMLLFLDNEYEKRLFQKETSKFCLEKNVSNDIIKNVENVLVSKNRSKMDFEYNEFCELKYLDISPYQSPELSKLIEDENLPKDDLESNGENEIVCNFSEDIKIESNFIKDNETFFENNSEKSDKTNLKEDKICENFTLKEVNIEIPEIVLAKKIEKEKVQIVLKDSLLEKMVHNQKLSKLFSKHTKQETKIKTEKHEIVLQNDYNKEKINIVNNTKDLTILNFTNTNVVKNEPLQMLKNDVNLENVEKKNEIKLNCELKPSFIKQDCSETTEANNKTIIKNDIVEENKNQVLPPVKLKIKLSRLNIKLDEEKMNGVLKKNEEKQRKKEEKRIRKEEKRERKLQKKLKRMQEMTNFDLKKDINFVQENVCNKIDTEYESECQTNGLKIKIFTRKVNLNAPILNTYNNSLNNLKGNNISNAFDESLSSKQSTSNKVPEKNSCNIENNESLKLRISKLLLPSLVLKNNTNSYNNCCDTIPTSHSSTVVEINEDNNVIKTKIEKSQKVYRKRKIYDDSIEPKRMNKKQDVFMPPLKIRLKKHTSENYLTKKSINTTTHVLDKTNIDLNKQKQLDNFSKNFHCKKNFITETKYMEQQKLIKTNSSFKKNFELEISKSGFVNDFSRQSQQQNYFSSEQNLFNGYFNNCLSNNKIMFNQLIPKGTWNTKVIEQVKFSPCSEDDSDDIRLRDKTDKLLNKLINKEQSRV